MITKEWLEKMKKQIMKSGSNNRDADWVFMPKEPGKKMVFRIIDPPKQEGFAEVIYKHYGVPHPDDGRPHTFNCLKNYSMECPICNVIMTHRDVAEIRRMRSTPRYYYNVLIRRHDEMPDFDSERVYIMVSPPSVFTSIFKYLTEPEYLIEDLLDPHIGYDIIIERLPDNKLSVEAARRPSPLLPDEEKIKQVLESVYDLKSFLPEYDDSMLEQAKKIASEIANGIRRLEESISHTQIEPTTPNVTTSPNQGVATPNTPDCFGKYNPSSVDCLSCPHEIACLKETKQ